MGSPSIKTKQQEEHEKEQRIEQLKNRQAQQRMLNGEMKNQKIQFKIEEAYKKMESWQNELERREKQAEDNLQKQQQIL